MRATFRSVSGKTYDCVSISDVCNFYEFFDCNVGDADLILFMMRHQCFT